MLYARAGKSKKKCRVRAKRQRNLKKPIIQFLALITPTSIASEKIFRAALL